MKLRKKFFVPWLLSSFLCANDSQVIKVTYDSRFEGENTPINSVYILRLKKNLPTTSRILSNQSENSINVSRGEKVFLIAEYYNANKSKEDLYFKGGFQCSGDGKVVASTKRGRIVFSTGNDTPEKLHCRYTIAKSELESK